MRIASCRFPEPLLGPWKLMQAKAQHVATGLIVLIKNEGAKGPISRAKLNQFKLDKLLIES